VADPVVLPFVGRDFGVTFGLVGAVRDAGTPNDPNTLMSASVRALKDHRDRRNQHSGWVTS